MIEIDPFHGAIYNRKQNIKDSKFFLSISHRDNLNTLNGV